MQQSMITRGVASFPFELAHKFFFQTKKKSSAMWVFVFCCQVTWYLCVHILCCSQGTQQASLTNTLFTSNFQRCIVIAASKYLTVDGPAHCTPYTYWPRRKWVSEWADAPLCWSGPRLHWDKRRTQREAGQQLRRVQERVIERRSLV